MKNKFGKKFKLFLVLISGLILITPNFYNFSKAEEAETSVIVVTVCGNNFKEQGEECDSSDLAGMTCASLGYSSGSLSCNPNCTFNTANCSSGGGGGGGGGGGAPPIVITQVNFSGRAYPLSKVNLLKDGQLVLTTIAGPDANFSISLTGLSSGNYTFTLFGEDNQGRRSSPFTFPVYITQGMITNITGIFISPTITVDKSQVKKGDDVAIFGQSAPNADITINVNSLQDLFVKAPSDKNGVYLYNFDTSPLDMGQHLTKSKAAIQNSVSSYSNSIGFLVGNTNVAYQPQKCPQKADLNDDCRVNLVDFSIAAYWYKRPLSDAFKVKEKEKLSGDGKIDLVDFSIMAYYWTG